MAWAYNHVCTKCKQLTMVYLDREESPAYGEEFEFVCPHCQEENKTFPVISPIQVIPEDAVIVRQTK